MSFHRNQPVAVTKGPAVGLAEELQLEPGVDCVDLPFHQRSEFPLLLIVEVGLHVDIGVQGKLHDVLAHERIRAVAIPDQFVEGHPSFSLLVCSHLVISDVLEKPRDPGCCKNSTNDSSPRSVVTEGSTRSICSGVNPMLYKRETSPDEFPSV